MSELIDISVALDDELPTWPGSPGFRVKPLQRMVNGAEANVSRLDCDVHTGTHVDAPRHFVDDGATVDQIPLDDLVGPAVVAHAPGVDTITADVLAELDIPADTKRLLLRTSNSALWQEQGAAFHSDYVALTPGAAHWVVGRGIRCIGVDYLSVQAYDDGPGTHRALLRAGVVIIEALDLSGIDPGRYELLCLPIKLGGVEGAPARVALRTK